MYVLTRLGGKELRAESRKRNALNQVDMWARFFYCKTVAVELQANDPEKELVLHNSLHFSFQENTIWLCYQRLGVTL